VSEADVARIVTQELEAEQAVDSAQRDVDTDRATLGFLIGVRGITPQFVAHEDALTHFTPHPQMEAADQQPEQLLEASLAQRPDYLAAQATQQRAEAAVALAHRNIIPDISLSLQYVQQGPGPMSPQPPTFAVVLSSALPVLYQQQGEIQRANADARAGAFQVDKARLQVASDLQTSIAQLLAAQRLVQRMEGGLLKRSAEARDLVTVQYQKGAASLLEYLDAQRTFIATNSEYLQNVKDYWTAVFRLEQAQGRESEQ
jgi:cobalt-zinc-cadmium efflux system outer membrane protein